MNYKGKLDTAGRTLDADMDYNLTTTAITSLTTLSPAFPMVDLL